METGKLSRPLRQAPDTGELGFRNMRLTIMKFYSQPRRSGLAGNLQSAARGRLSFNSFQVKEARSSLRASFPEEFVNSR